MEKTHRSDRAGTAPRAVHGWGRRHRRLLGWPLAVVATGLAGLWLVVVPGKAEQADGWQEAAIRWGHPVCWALLAVVGVLVAVEASPRIRDAVAWAAAACYAAFLVGMVA